MGRWGLGCWDLRSLGGGFGGSLSRSFPDSERQRAVGPPHAPGHLHVATKELSVPQDADRERPERAAHREALYHRESPPGWGPWQAHPALLRPTTPHQHSSFQQGPPPRKLTTVRCEEFPQTLKVSLAPGFVMKLPQNLGSSTGRPPGIAARAQALSQPDLSSNPDLP